MMKTGSRTRAHLFYRCLILIFITDIAGAQHTPTPSSTGESILQKRYSAAQRFQASGDLSHAAEQYRIFLADALGEIASGWAQAGQYAAAKDDFDEALRLVPDFPVLQLEYAHAALRSGDTDHAEMLANELLQKYAGQVKVESEAHRILGEAFLAGDRNAEAKVQFEAAVLLDASFANGYELAVAELNLGDLEAARKVFAEMLSSFGDTAALHMYFGQAYGNSDFQSEAVAEFQKALETEPHLRGVHYSLAVAYLATEGDSKLAAAESQLREEISISPRDALAYAALGHLLATHGEGAADRAQAEFNLKKSTELDSMNPDSFLYLGQFYADQKRLPEAEGALRRSIALTPDVSRNAFQVQKAHYLLARLLMQTGDKVEAEKEFAVSQALLKQNLSRDQGRLSEYLGEKGRSGVAAEFKQSMQAPGQISANHLQSTGAVDAFETRLKPAIADSYNNLGAVAASTEDYSVALTYFQRARVWDPSTPGLDFNWGRAAFAAAKYDQAVAPLRHYLLAHPHEDGARRVLGLSEFMIKDYGGARETLASLALNREESPKIQFAYADSLLRTGDASAAIPLLESLRKNSPEVPEVSSALVEAYAAAGRKSERPLEK